MAFKDTDKTVFIARSEDGSVNGYWSVRQFAGQEEQLANDPEMIAYINKLAPHAPKKLSDGALADLLVSKGYLTAGDVAVAVAAISVDVK